MATEWLLGWFAAPVAAHDRPTIYYTFAYTRVSTISRILVRRTQLINYLIGTQETHQNGIEMSFEFSLSEKD